MTLDLLHAFRNLRQNWAFTLATMLVFGLGIAANSAIYSYMRALVHEPILVPGLDRVLLAGGEHPRRAGDIADISAVDFLDWRDQSQTLEHVSGWTGFQAVISGSGTPESIIAMAVSHPYFSALGATPLLGRSFLAQEDAPGLDDAIILTERMWRRRFGADPRITEKQLVINNRAVRIVGVMPGDQVYPPDAEAFVPLALSDARKRNDTARFLNVVARMKPGVNLTQARAELSSIAAGTRRRFPDSHREFRPFAGQLSDYFSGPDTPRYLGFSLLAAGFLLLLASATAANLHFARVSARWREMAVRSALGSSRWRLARQIMTESALLVAGGILTGLLLAAWTIEALRSSLPPDVETFLPGWRRVGLDRWALAFTITVSALAGLLSGIAACVGGLKIQPADVLRSSKSGGRHRLRSALVVVQASLAIMLLTGASVMRTGVGAVSQPRPGMDAAHVLWMSVALDRDRYAAPTKIEQLQNSLMEGARALPGVTQVAIATDVPYDGGRSTTQFEVDGEPVGRDRRSASLASISEHALTIVRIPSVRGRVFSAADSASSAKVAIVNEAFARQYLGGTDPLSRKVRVAGEWRTIVGVASDTRHTPIDRNVLPLIYQPASQAPPRFFRLLLRTEGDPGKLSGPVRELLAKLDPAQPARRILPYSEIIDNQVNGLHWASWILGVIGSLAMLLSVGGIYSVMAFSVNERTREIGVRMALGARESDIAAGVTGRGVRLTALGLLIGCPLAFALVQAMGGLIPGVSPLDPLSWARVLVLLVAAAVAASAIPSLRAARVDPAVALRSE